MSNETIQFEERQFLGYNKFSLMRRILLALFCFLVYYFSDEIPSMPDGKNTDDFIFVVGVGILLLSCILMFVLHLHTKIENNSLILDGLWTARKVKIDLSSIIKAEKIDYSRYLLNRPVYNLHRKGKIRFFTRGNDAVMLTDKDGLQYIVGSQKADELQSVVLSIIQPNQA